MDRNDCVSERIRRVMASVDEAKDLVNRIIDDRQAAKEEENEIDKTILCYKQVFDKVE